MASDPSVKTTKKEDKKGYTAPPAKDDEKKEASKSNVLKSGKKKKKNHPHTSLSKEIAFSIFGRRFDISRSIGGGITPDIRSLGDVDKVFDYDPEWFVNNLGGTWHGKEGVDTVFVVPLAGGPQNTFATGFSTTYEETIICHKLDGWTLNPMITSKDNPVGVFNGAEMLFGVRYTRVVTSTQEDANGEHPFPAGKQIHDETGYILFSYKGSPFGDSYKFELQRIIHSFTMPRGLTVNANCEVNNATINQDNGTLNFTDAAGTKNSNPLSTSWTVASSTHFWGIPPAAPVGDHSGTGRVTGVSTKNEINFVDGGIGSTWTYKQESPFLFPINWEHDNSNKLIKASN